MEINEIYNENCLNTMAKMPSNFTDLTITSPPYDNLRTYNGYSFDFKNIAKELYRITKNGGIVVWVIGDQTFKGSESGTSFKQALYFKDIGFNLHDTMIYQKHGMPTDPRLRYYQRFEYMFVFSKGKPKSYYAISDVLSSNRKQSNGTDRKGDELITTKKKYLTPKYGVRGNIWTYDCRNMKTGHPASFPEKLAHDHILSWSNEGDLIYDPFMGSGTTAKMAILSNRNWIGSEISKEYCDIIKQRIKIKYEQKK